MSNPNPHKPLDLVEILVKNHGTGDWVPCWVTRQGALATHQPGLIPPPGRKAQ